MCQLRAACSLAKVKERGACLRRQRAGLSAPGSFLVLLRLAVLYVAESDRGAAYSELAEQLNCSAAGSE